MSQPATTFTDPLSSRPPLSPLQERRLVEYLDNKLLDLTRAHKKRSQPTSSARTLPEYLSAARPLLGLILQIPPAAPSGSLRTTLLLRLTGDVLGSFAGYIPTADALASLLEFCHLLDAAWLAVLRKQAWDSSSNVGVDDGNSKSAPGMSATERARLRSLLISGTDTLSDWLEGAANASEMLQDDSDANNNADRLSTALKEVSVRQGLEDIFTSTLGEMGVLEGIAPLVPPQFI